MMQQASPQVYDEDYAADRAAIEDLMARYLFALDYNDMETFATMFTQDAAFDFARGRVEGLDNIIQTVKAFKERIGAVYVDEDGNPAILRHVLAHTTIRVEGDQAWTRAQWFEMANDGPGKSLKMGTFGIYEDRLRKVDGRWLFAERKILNDFLEGRHTGPENPVRTMDALAGASQVTA
jgi:ketosteroid isomerase-like protein